MLRIDDEGMAIVKRVECGSGSTGQQGVHLSLCSANANSCGSIHSPKGPVMVAFKQANARQQGAVARNCPPEDTMMGSR